MIIIETESFENSNKNITGAIYIGNDKFHFPEKGWNDFVVIITNWWIESINKVKATNNFECDFNFMDGPYSLKLKGDKKIITAHCIEREKVIYCFQFKKNTLLNNLRLNSERILKICSDKSWKGSEIEKLEVNLKKLVFSNK